MTDPNTDSRTGETVEPGLARRTVVKATAVVGSVGAALNTFSTLGRARGNELENTITVQATGGVASYRFEVSGDVELTANAGGGEDEIRDNTVTGKVGGHSRDTFRFSGHIHIMDTREGPIEVVIDFDEAEHTDS